MAVCYFRPSQQQSFVEEKTTLSSMIIETVLSADFYPHNQDISTAEFIRLKNLNHIYFNILPSQTSIKGFQPIF